MKINFMLQYENENECVAPVSRFNNGQDIEWATPNERHYTHNSSVPLCIKCTLNLNAFNPMFVLVRVLFHFNSCISIYSFYFIFFFFFLFFSLARLFSFVSCIVFFIWMWRWLVGCLFAFSSNVWPFSLGLREFRFVSRDSCIFIAYCRK